MNRQIVAICVQEAGRLISGLLSLRTPKIKSVTSQPYIEPPAEPQEMPAEQENIKLNVEKKIEEGTACLPCVNSHMHACVGLLNEATRMSHDGITPEGVKRVDTCLSEIVAAERIDLAPENVANLAPEEKRIANHASKELREIRHDLEGLKSPDELQQIAAKTAKLQHYVASEWFKYRLAKMPIQN